MGQGIVRLGGMRLGAGLRFINTILYTIIYNYDYRLKVRYRLLPEESDF